MLKRQNYELVIYRTSAAFLHREHLTYIRVVAEAQKLESVLALVEINNNRHR